MFKNEENKINVKYNLWNLFSLYVREVSLLSNLFSKENIFDIIIKKFKTYVL